MAETPENLKEAFAGESQANQRYLAFAKEAETEGYPQIARLFRAAAAAETVHAHNHLRQMDGIGDTAENLEAAIAGEAGEFKSMYPAFIQEARAEGNKGAERTFDLALQVERIHHELYSSAAQKLKEGQDFPYANFFVCRGCGNTVVDEVPDKCPICGAPKSWFMWIQ